MTVIYSAGAEVQNLAQGFYANSKQRASPGRLEKFLIDQNSCSAQNLIISTCVDVWLVFG